MNNINSNNVVIIGAGPAGLCLARALALQGVHVDIVERQPETVLADPAFDGREIALNHRSIRILTRLGIWGRIPDSAIYPLRMAHVSDGCDKGFDVDAAAFGGDRLGNLVSNNVIRAAAWKIVQDTDLIHVHSGVEAKAIEQNNGGHIIHLADGKKLSASLLVAADSRFSHIRRLLGVPVAMHDFGKAMLVCRMRHETPHNNVAYEWFGRGQTRALLPLDEYISSLVLTVTEREAERLHILDEKSFARDMEERLEHKLGAMELISTRHVYPLVGTWAKKFVGPGFALVGDTAVGMHPVTAHGFNLGLASVDRLVNAVNPSLAQGGSIADPAALAHYQRRHRAGALPLFLGTGAIVGLYTDDRIFVRPIRHTLIGHMRRFRPLQKTLAATVMDVFPRA